ncbi:DinB family protein [Emticicia sp. BO119]|uniref:DinB family protein n=1 Tax=Emticicia sp. BO119 TaxID=2757768 RepID=UPI0015F112BA|nr:DinB family protein [Emticicia sp. BO119]MBA4853128.1 DinB family protein [Emticicia sp. BO119]
MRKIDKFQLLESLENEVETHLQIAIHTFQNLNETALLQIPVSGGWSIAQCFEHLNSYGRYYLPQIKNALNKDTNKGLNSFFKGSWLGSYFTKMMRPSNTKKYKAFKDHIPPMNLHAHAVLAEFIEQQETLLNYLKQARGIDLDNIRIPISISKWVRLKLGDVFQFIIAHDERHIQQAKRVLSIIKDFQF